MSNFVELSQEELAEVSGGSIVIPGLIILALELAATAYLEFKMDAMDALGGKKYPGVI